MPVYPISMYYVDSDADEAGVHYVHRIHCINFPYIKSPMPIGPFSVPSQAMDKARTMYDNAAPCGSCLPCKHKV